MLGYFYFASRILFQINYFILVKEIRMKTKMSKLLKYIYCSDCRFAAFLPFLKFIGSLKETYSQSKNGE